MIIAIGESLVAIGLDAQQFPLRTAVLITASLGFVVVASFWLACFHFFCDPRSDNCCPSARAGRTTLRAHRDVYTYLSSPDGRGHRSLFAFALKETLLHAAR